MAAVGGFELHYYLADDEHSMDAMLRNRCEAELLAIFYEVSSCLGIPVEIQAQALAEGGVKEVWKWVGENATQLNVVLPVIAILIALAPQVYESDEETLSKELTELSIEEKKLQIEKLRRGAKEVTPNTESTVREDAVNLLMHDPKIRVRKSNFYKNLMGSDKVKKIGMVPLNSNLMPEYPERKVERDKFHLYVLTSHSIKPETIDDATIEIISPVLREGSYKWKGIFRNQPIGFSMQDNAFRSQVLREKITFQHGTFLECALNINRKLDEVGEVEITGYVVTTVIRKYDDRQSVETSQGKTYKHAKKLSESQNDLFGGGK